MTKVILKQRPMHAVQLASAADAMRFRLGDSIVVRSVPRWWSRALAWIAITVFRRAPKPSPSLKVVAVNHDSGSVMLELQQ